MMSLHCRRLSALIKPDRSTSRFPRSSSSSIAYESFCLFPFSGSQLFQTQESLASDTCRPRAIRKGLLNKAQIISSVRKLLKIPVLLKLWSKKGRIKTNNCRENENKIAQRQNHTKTQTAASSSASINDGRVFIVHIKLAIYGLFCVTRVLLKLSLNLAQFL